MNLINLVLDAVTWLAAAVAFDAVTWLATVVVLMNMIQDAAITWLAAAVVFDGSGHGRCSYLASYCHCSDESEPGRCCYLASRCCCI